MKKVLAVLVAVLMLQAGIIFAQDKAVKPTDGKLIFAKGLYNFDFCVHFTSNIRFE